MGKRRIIWELLPNAYMGVIDKPIKKSWWCEDWCRAKGSFVVSFCRLCGQGNSWEYHGKFMCHSNQEKWVLGMPWQSCCSPPFPLLSSVSNFVIKVSSGFLLSLTSSFDKWPQGNWIVIGCPVLCGEWLYVPVMGKVSHGKSPIKKKGVLWLWEIGVLSPHVCRDWLEL